VGKDPADYSGAQVCKLHFNSIKAQLAKLTYQHLSIKNNTNAMITLFQDALGNRRSIGYSSGMHMGDVEIKEVTITLSNTITVSNRYSLTPIITNTSTMIF
jgi:hypothetical protein